MTDRGHRRSIRLLNYDYASPGGYFVTTCTCNRECVFDDRGLRGVVETTWQQIPCHFPIVMPDEFVVMPNHVHGIIWIAKAVDRRNVGAQHAAPLLHAALAVRPGSLGAMVRAFKAAATKLVNETRGTPGAPVWQRNYYERVIRNENELARIREYIRLNPLRWNLDRENPQRVADADYDREWRWLEGRSLVGAQHAAPLHPEAAGST